MPGKNKELAEELVETRRKLLKCVAALEAVRNCIDTDSVTNYTECGEIEYSISYGNVQLICDSALAALKEKE